MKKSDLMFIVFEIEIVLTGILDILVEYNDFSIKLFYYIVLLFLIINYLLYEFYEDKKEEK